MNPARSMVLFASLTLTLATVSRADSLDPDSKPEVRPHSADSAGPALAGARSTKDHSRSPEADPKTQTLVVTATAYNSLANQTDSDPTTAAWGDSLLPGMKTIAVSPDLIPAGLDRHTPVSIEGLPGKYRVLDKMPDRWTNKIDIYMGVDVDAALAWGRREVRIHW